MTKPVPRTMTWKDMSSYSRGARVEEESRIWELQGAPGRLTVHRYMTLEGWFMTCSELGLDCYELKAEDVESAKLEALDLAYGRVTQMAQAWEAFLGKPTE